MDIVDDKAVATEDEPFTSTESLLANDSDPNGGTLTITAGTFTTAKGGTIVIDADGNYTYTPPENFSGIDSVDYTVSNGNLTDTATLTIDVSPKVEDCQATFGDLNNDTVADNGNTRVDAPADTGLLQTAYFLTRDTDANPKDGGELAKLIDTDVHQPLVSKTITSFDPQYHAKNDPPKDDTMGVQEGHAQITEGLVYLEAGQQVVFKGYVDNLIKIELGGRDILWSRKSDTYGKVDSLVDGTFDGRGTNPTQGKDAFESSGVFTVGETGYYTMKIYNSNLVKNAGSKNAGAIDLTMSVDGGATYKTIDTNNFDLYRNVSDLIDADAQFDPTLNTSIQTSEVPNEDSDVGEGYYAIKINQGFENSAIELSSIMVSASPSTDNSTGPTDGGLEQMTQMTLSGLPAGATITDGTNTATVTDVSQKIDITNWDKDNLVLDNAPAGNYTISVTTTGTDTAELSTGTVTDTKDCVKTFDVEVLSKNHPPVADDDFVPGTRDPKTGNLQPTIINVIDGDSDVDGTIDPTTVEIIGGANGGKELVVDGEGTWTVDNTGKITFTPEAGFNDDPTPIQYTVKDDKGLMSNPATVWVDYSEPMGGTPELQPIAATRISEEGLVGGIKDTEGNADTTDDAVSVMTGAIKFTDGDSAASDFSFNLQGPNDVTVDGQAVSWTWDAASKTMTGSATLDGTDTEVMTVVVGDVQTDGAGAFKADYTATLLHAIDHPSNNDEDQLQLDFAATVSDGQNTSLSQNLSVIVEDDRPVIRGGEESVLLQPITSNIIIAMDSSGSMGVGSGVFNADGTEKSRLDVAIKAVDDLIDGYTNIGDVRVQLVEFDTNASIPSDKWLTPVQAKAVLETYSKGGCTNYDAALEKVIDAYDNPGAIPNADRNLAYFITDAFPTKGTSDFTDVDHDYTGEGLGGNELNGNCSDGGHPDSGIQAGEEAQWISFLKDKGITSYAFAVGNDVVIDDIKPIAYDGVNGVDNDGTGDSDGLARRVLDMNFLSDELLKTLPTPTESLDLLTGNILAGSEAGFGADGDSKFILTVDGVSYNYDRASKTMTTDAAADKYDYDKASTILTVKLDSGAVLALNFATGKYDYTVAQTVEGYKEPISFSVEDSDGDVQSAEQVLDIYRLLARDDSIITNETTEVTIDEAVLKANDVYRDTSNVTEVANAVGGTLSGNDPFVFTFDGSNDGFGTAATTITEDADDSENNDTNGSAFSAVDLTDRSLFGPSNNADAPQAKGLVEFKGNIVGSGDQDFVKVSLKAGEKLIADVDGGRDIGDSINTQMKIFNADFELIGDVHYGNKLSGGATDPGSNYNGDWSSDPYAEYIAEETGDYYIKVEYQSGADTEGDYTLWVGIDDGDGVTTSQGSFDYKLNDKGPAGNKDVSALGDVDIRSQVGDTITGTDKADTLIGRAGQSDTLLGEAGNDVLQGRSGDDTLTGGDGDDIFIWTAADKGSVGTPDTDTVTDFGTGNDKLNLSDLLPSADDNNIADYISVSGADMYINTNGGASNTSYDLHIVLDGNTSDLDTLINSNQLII
ncbi:MAG: hypothetical protein CR975_03880 [Gammaproteobacteria bacterium]|nr:MAG: hypothetical protein CR975_03880 [Gammaproteobacteria bacterium]